MSTKDHAFDKNGLKKLGLAIRLLRLERDISQEELAYLAGIDRSYFGGIERGQRNVAVKNLLLISKALGVKLYQIFEKAKL